MTIRQILAALEVGESKTFETLELAESAGAAFCKFYCGRAFKRRGLTITRIANRWESSVEAQEATA